jgi:hypothetical protein
MHLITFHSHTIYGIRVYCRGVNFAYLDNIDGHAYIELGGCDGVASQRECCVGVRGCWMSAEYISDL